MSVYEKIVAGAYTTTLPYPENVKEPAILRKMVRELTEEQLSSIPSIRAEYKAAKANERAAREAYHNALAVLTEAFRRDLEDEFGMKGHPKANMLWCKAWERGHSGGFAEIFNAYDDYVELMK